MLCARNGRLTHLDPELPALRMRASAPCLTRVGHACRRCVDPRLARDRVVFISIRIGKRSSLHSPKNPLDLLTLEPYASP